MAGPAEMPFRNWYTTNTNHFHLTDSVRRKSKSQSEIKNTMSLSANLYTDGTTMTRMEKKENREMMNSDTQSPTAVVVGKQGMMYRSTIALYWYVYQRTCLYCSSRGSVLG